MILNELKFYLKKYKIMILILYLQTTLFLIILGTFIAFIEELNYESKNLQQIYEGKAIYQLIDRYYDGDEYQKFTSRPDYLNSLKNFYKELHTSNDFQFLSMFDHHILIKDEGIPLEMIEGYENGREKYQQEINDKLYTAVKSFQMNAQALDFFGLDVSEGEIWDEQDFSDTQKIMPVLLGNSYRDVYKIGDELTINYYQKTIPIKIIGFLEPNSNVYFKNDTQFFLDRYILLPYIDYEKQPTSDIDEKFEQISYFAMINGYVVTENNPSSTQNMMQRIEAIAQKASFEYSFIGLNPHFQQYRGLMTVLQEDKMLVQSIFVSFFILNLIMINIILLLQQNRRLSFFATHFINGATKWHLVRMQWREISIIWLAAFSTNFIILNQILKIGDYKTQFYLLILVIVMSIIACLLPTCKLIFNPIVNFLHNEDEGGK
ncbi:hypothetical protein [Paenibacillus eucommiae]|uniref:ABC transporter permease n=1 Tax=Paenibacillus eucommiae TaxID=1355755 RepID=A0ABS4IWD9_9BACL|nr:hypothetical protein [Paenibacillus eucommiae]MBP1991912.1 hypothetical protein [Paenibacillus eucommiae]